jgi:metal-responsive CopG/Arc/MetJ family transcriptional regulator
MANYEAKGRPRLKKGQSVTRVSFSVDRAMRRKLRSTAKKLEKSESEIFRAMCIHLLNRPETLQSILELDKAD